MQTFGFVHGLRMFIEIHFFSNKINIPGLQYPIHIRKSTSDKNVFQQIFLRKDYDIRYPAPVKTIVDAGANIGLAALFFRLKYPDAKIICIEPDEKNYQQLCKNTAGYQNIINLRAALWSSITSVIISNNNAEAWLFSVEECEAEDIETVTIENLMHTYHLDGIDILKVDIEGSEKELFENGSEAWLPLCRTLVVEIHDNLKKGASKAVFTAISKHNFEFRLKGENLFFCQTVS